MNFIYTYELVVRVHCTVTALRGILMKTRWKLRFNYIFGGFRANAIIIMAHEGNCVPAQQ